MKKSIKNTAQAGFTLIELIVVIVILGILAATALPKFASLGGDARVASLQAAKASLNSVAAMSHGKYLIDPTQTSTSMEGNTVTFAGSSGYPLAAQATADAAGLAVADYAVIVGPTTLPASGPTLQPIIAVDTIAVVPASVAGTATAANCYISYSISATAAKNVTPTVDVTHATADNCN
jgi:MSHA pilin protein MshA